MKPVTEWFIYIEDQDNKSYCLDGPVTEENSSEIFDILQQEHAKGRDLSFQEVPPSQLRDITIYAKSIGFKETQTWVSSRKPAKIPRIE